MSDFYALALFSLFVLGLLALDLRVTGRRDRPVSFRQATLLSSVWVALSLAFNVAIYYLRGPQPALEFLTGYVLEKSLSLDNVFAFAAVFSYAAVPAAYQRKVLLWGVLGALAIRGVLIVTGVALVSRFHWVPYGFGLFLLLTGAKTLTGKSRPLDFERNPALRLARTVFPITERYEGSAFFVRRGGRLMATPLLLVVVVVETTDLLFALDSIPAIFAVTLDPFIVYTSNVFAVLGLRAMYFFLEGALARFRYLRAGISVVLMFVGMKMLLLHFFRIPILLTLGIISVTIAGAIFASVRRSGDPQAGHSK